MNILKRLFGIKEKSPETETEISTKQEYRDFYEKLDIILEKNAKISLEKYRIEAINLDLKASGQRLTRAGKSTLRRKIWRS